MTKAIKEKSAFRSTHLFLEVLSSYPYVAVDKCLEKPTAFIVICKMKITWCHQVARSLTKSVQFWS